VSRLLILIQPQNLQAMLGETLATPQRDERRATFIRETLVK
jgi:protein-arginine kinase